MTALTGWIGSSMVDQRQAATILGVTPAVVSDLIHGTGECKGLTIDRLVDLLLRTGKQVKVSVQ